MKLKIKHINIPVYSGKITVIIFNNDRKPLHTYLKRKGIDIEPFKNDLYDGLQLSYTNPKKDTHTFIIAINKGNSDAYETLIHELYHLNQSILEYYEVDYRKGTSNEAYAYLMGILAKKITPLLK